MRVAGTSDWRDAIPFDTPIVVEDVVPGEPAHCSVCGNGSAPRPRTELWALKQRHPHHHDGYVRFFCADHLPETRPPARVAAPRSARAVPKGERVPAVRRSPAVDERPRALCPNCFIEVPSSGLCGVCGEKVA